MTSYTPRMMGEKSQHLSSRFFKVSKQTPVCWSFNCLKSKFGSRGLKGWSQEEWDCDCVSGACNGRTMDDKKKDDMSDELLM